MGSGYVCFFYIHRSLDELLVVQYADMGYGMWGAIGGVRVRG